MRPILTFLAFAGLLPAPATHAQKLITDGYITAISSPVDFDFNGMHVILSPKTEFTVDHSDAAPKYTTRVTALPALYLGEVVVMTGEVKSQSREIKAKKIVFDSPPSHQVSGTGIIDLIPTPAESEKDIAGGRLIRADGYLLLIPASAAVTFTPPIASVSEIRTNQWIAYHGRQRQDGVVLVDQATFSANTINRREDKLRARRDYDPSVIDTGDAQSGASKFFKGKDPTRLPAWHDEAMQARVEKVGKSLIPAFQRALPEDDSTRIDFRFQVTDESKHDDAWSFASGIILIPHQVVERLPDDSQLAAVLADSIAEVLEKQDLRIIPAKHKMTAAQLAGDAAGIFVPGASLVPLIANHAVGKSMLDHSRQQSGRVSLSLMHDAGYDLAAAPRAWWMLAAKSPGDPLPTRMPDHTLFLYEDLGTTWRTVLAAPQTPHAVATANP